MSFPMRYLWIVLVPALVACGRGLTGEIRYSFLNDSFAECKVEVARTGERKNPEAIREFCRCQSVEAANILSNHDVSKVKNEINAKAVSAIKNAVTSARKGCVHHLSQ